MCGTIGRDSRIDDITARFKRRFGFLPIPILPCRTGSLFTGHRIYVFGIMVVSIRTPGLEPVQEQGRPQAGFRFWNPSKKEHSSCCSVLRGTPRLDITLLPGNVSCIAHVHPPLISSPPSSSFRERTFAPSLSLLHSNYYSIIPLAST